MIEGVEAHPMGERDLGAERANRARPCCARAPWGGWCIRTADHPGAHEAHVNGGTFPRQWRGGGR